MKFSHFIRPSASLFLFIVTEFPFEFQKRAKSHRETVSTLKHCWHSNITFGQAHGWKMCVVVCEQGERKTVRWWICVQQSEHAKNSLWRVKIHRWSACARFDRIVNNSRTENATLHRYTQRLLTFWQCELQWQRREWETAAKSRIYVEQRTKQQALFSLAPSLHTANICFNCAVHCWHNGKWAEPFGHICCRLHALWLMGGNERPREKNSTVTSHVHGVRTCELRMCTLELSLFTFESNHFTASRIEKRIRTKWDLHNRAKDTYWCWHFLAVLFT